MPEDEKEEKKEKSSLGTRYGKYGKRTYWATKEASKEETGDDDKKDKDDE